MRPPSPPPEWQEDAAIWPLRQHSQFVRAGVHDWHVQTRSAEPGEPTLILLHGTGASGHSFAGLARALPAGWGFVIPDLPGHGFTRPHGRFQPTRTAMAQAVAALLVTLAVPAATLIGHSAGAAIALTLTRLSSPPATPFIRVISLNGALRPFDGAAGFLFPVMARLMSFNPLLAPALAASARDPARVEALLRQTGGALPPQESVRCYARLLRCRRHISGALAMMANWNLSAMEEELARQTLPVTFIAGALDRAVPPGDAARFAAQTPGASHALLQELGHLAHEQDPETVMAAMFPA